MKTRSKALLLSLCAIALVASTVFGTLAYLTDTHSAINTFTVGNVNIELDEAAVTPDGAEIPDAERVKENAYHLLPGHTYVKDPTVTVLSGSEESYVRMVVTVDFGTNLPDAWLKQNLDNIFTGFDAENWTRAKKTVTDMTDAEVAVEGAQITNTKIVYEYRHNTTVKGQIPEVVNGQATGSFVAGDNKLTPLFTGIAIPGEWTNEQIALFQNMVITVKADAIQANLTNEITDVEKAWEAFDKQYTPAEGN